MSLILYWWGKLHFILKLSMAVALHFYKNYPFNENIIFLLIEKKYWYWIFVIYVYKSTIKCKFLQKINKIATLWCNRNCLLSTGSILYYYHLLYTLFLSDQKKRYFSKKVWITSSIFYKNNVFYIFDVF
jgi:hypothetical protein